MAFDLILFKEMHELFVKSRWGYCSTSLHVGEVDVHVSASATIRKRTTPTALCAKFEAKLDCPCGVWLGDAGNADFIMCCTTRVDLLKDCAKWLDCARGSQHWGTGCITFV